MNDKTFTEVEASGEIQFIKSADLKTLEGTFLGIDNSGEYGPNYKFENADGDILVVNGSGALNKKMAKVPEGSQVRLENLGMEKITTGKFAGKSFHNIKVEVADLA